MAVNISGVDPEGKTRFYAIQVQPSWVADFIEVAKSLGWTELGTTPYIPVPDSEVEEPKDKKKRTR